MNTVRTLLADSMLLPLDAEILLAHVLERSRAWLIAHADDPVNDHERRRFFSLAKRRAGGQPIAYLTGWREFWSLPLQVTSDTLIPRPDTELLVERALIDIPTTSASRVLDLGTGAGGIAIAIAKERPRAIVTATDISPAAIALARANALRLGLLDHVEFIVSSWFSALTNRRFDLIVCNPPYVPQADPHLQQGDCAWEPRLALVSGHDGLAAYRDILASAANHLTRSGSLLFEHGCDQADAVAKLASEAGFESPHCYRDLAGHPRVTVAQMHT